MHNPQCQVTVFPNSLRFSRNANDTYRIAMILKRNIDAFLRTFVQIVFLYFQRFSQLACMIADFMKAADAISICRGNDDA